MAALSEKDVTSQFVGKVISMEKLTKCAHRNGTGNAPAVYIAYSCGFLYNQELRELFGVTDKLKEQWERRGIDFNVGVHISGDRIIYCGIAKYNESDGARPSYRDLKCTQQELRVAKRILEYITMV